MNTPNQYELDSSIDSNSEDAQLSARSNEQRYQHAQQNFHARLFKELSEDDIQFMFEEAMQRDWIAQVCPAFP